MIMAAGTYKKVNTFLRPREFHTGYDWTWMHADERQMRSMFYFAWAQQGKPFNYTGMSQCLTKPRPTDHSSWYCAEYVMELLKHLPCAAIHLVRSNVVDLDEIHKLLFYSDIQDRAPRHLAPIELAQHYAR